MSRGKNSWYVLKQANIVCLLVWLWNEQSCKRQAVWTPISSYLNSQILWVSFQCSQMNRWTIVLDSIGAVIFLGSLFCGFLQLFYTVRGLFLGFHLHVTQASYFRTTIQPTPMPCNSWKIGWGHWLLKATNAKTLSISTVDELWGGNCQQNRARKWYYHLLLPSLFWSWSTCSRQINKPLSSPVRFSNGSFEAHCLHRLEKQSLHMWLAYISVKRLSLLGFGVIIYDGCYCKCAENFIF